MFNTLLINNLKLPYLKIIETKPSIQILKLKNLLSSHFCNFQLITLFLTHNILKL